VRRAGIGVFTMRDIDERGMRTVMEEALRMADAGLPVITFRSIWTGSIPKTHLRGTPVRGAQLIARPILPWNYCRPWRMLSFEIVEVNP